MLLLALGLALFTGTHLILSLAPDAVASRRARLGDGPIKGIVAILSLAGIVLIVLGWRSAGVSWVYTPPPGLRLPGLLLVAVGIYLFVVANRPSRVKTVLRHPQLTGLVLWSIGHLLMNGESRSLLLFAWLAIWAIHEIILINRRDARWEPAAAPGFATDVVTLVVALVAIYALAWAHPWLAGVAVLPAG
jgi:uncharacterized membrane protein